MAHFRIRKVTLSRDLGVSSLVSYNLVKVKMYIHVSKDYASRKRSSRGTSKTTAD